MKREIKIGQTGVCKGRKNTIYADKQLKFEVVGLADGVVCTVKLENDKITQIYVYGNIVGDTIVSDWTGQTTSLDGNFKNFKFNK